MTEEAVVFECRGDQLPGILHLPPENASSDQRLAVVNVVGGPQYRVGSHRQFLTTARYLARVGFPVLRFDYRGLGDADGEPRTFEAVDDDIEAAVNMLHARLPTHEIVLMGLCDAASAIFMFLSRRPSRIGGAVVMNPWARSEQTLARSFSEHYYGSRLTSRDFWHRLIRLEVNVAAAGWGFLRNQVKGRLTRPADGQPDFIARMRAGLQDNPVPLLVALSGADLTAREFESLVESDEGWRRLMNRPEVTTMRFERADHTFSAEEDLRAFNERVCGWLKALAGHPRQPGRVEPCR